MEKLILVVHLMTALSIIGLILLQQGKGAEVGASFGSGASQTIFGGSGGWSFFSKVTAIFAALFFATSLALTVIANNRVNSDSAILPELETVHTVEQQKEIPAKDEQQGSEIPVMDEAETGGESDSSDIPESSDIPQ